MCKYSTEVSLNTETCAAFNTIICCIYTTLAPGTDIYENLFNHCMKSFIWYKCLMPHSGHQKVFILAGASLGFFLLPCFNPWSVSFVFRFGKQILNSLRRKSTFIAGFNLKLNTTKAFLGTFLWQCRRNARPHRKHNALHTLRDVPRDKRFLLPPHPSHIYFIRCILHRLHGGRMAMRSDTHTHTHARTHTYTHATGPQMSTGACSDSMFFSSWSFFFSFFIHP